MDQRHGVAASALAGFAYQYVVGLHRFKLGLHYAYAAGAEILGGRLPYRDWHTWAGPVTWYLQAAFFKLGGLSYAGGYLLHAAVLNALAAAIVCAIVTRRVDGKAGLMAGALTAVWFYPIFTAHPWYDQEAFFFLIAALGLVELDALFWAGVAAGLSFYCKQSNGGAGIVMLAWYLGWRAPRFLLGVLATIGVFSAVLPRAHFYDLWVLPLKSGRAGFVRAPLFWLLGVVFAAVLRKVPLGFCLAACLVTSPYYLVFFIPLLFDRSDLTIALVLMQAGGRLTSNNEIKVFWPFMGLLFGLCRPKDMVAFAALLVWGLHLSYGHAELHVFPFATGLAALTCLALVPRHKVFAIAGVILMARAAVVWKQRAQRTDIARTKYEATVDDPQLRGVTMTREDADAMGKLLPLLKGRRFWAYSECELLYPLLGEAMPQRLLWYDPTATYKPGDGTDARVLEDFERLGIDTVVVCGGSPLEDLPAVKARVAQGTLEAEIPPLFKVYKLR